MKLVDTNLLVYAYVQALPQHAPARRWFEQALSEDEAVGLAWVSVLGFVRVVTSPRIFRVPLLLDRAVAVVDDWLAEQRRIWQDRTDRLERFVTDSTKDTQ